MRLASFAATSAAVVALASPVALANGRFPASNRVIVSAGDPNLVVARTTYGVLLSRDGGDHWGWLCEDIFGISSMSQEDPLIELTAAGRLVVGPGTNPGLFTSLDVGCGWSSVSGPMSSQLVKDLVVRPSGSDDVLAVTSTYGSKAGADGGPGYAQQLFESVAGGAWSAIGSPIDPSALVTTIEVAATDAQRVYVSALRGTSTARTASLFVSLDDGASWTERAIPIDPTRESSVFIAGVDPTTADRVYVRTFGMPDPGGSTNEPSRLLVTDDAGQTFRAVLSLPGEMVGFAIAGDGSKVYAGSMQDGLYVAPGDTLAFQKTSSIPIQCLATHGAELWACSAEQDGFIAGVSTDDGATFAPKLHLVAQPMVSCAADATASQCAGMPLAQFCVSLPGCIVPVDGGPDAGAGTPIPPVSTKSCSCSTPGGSGAVGVTLLAVVALVAGSVARRGSRRHASR